ncbi:macrolide family glycosyltransferase [Pseudonocardia nematodicida]|uniref:Macrolide family glycosyltransferase n=1 Tax=Pseudonocardia nematodicida TaxID=1206997 RepID=A0ABV1K9G2_9PSEU
MRSRHFTFVCMPAVGHVFPTLPLVAELVRRGHRVTYATGTALLDAVRSAGADAVEVPFVMPEHAPAPPPGEPPTQEQLRTRLEVFAGSVESVFPVLTAMLADDPPDAVCGDALIPVGALVARARELPYVTLRPTLATGGGFSMRDMLTPDDPMTRAMAEVFAHNGERIAAFAREHGLEPVGFDVPAALTLVFVPREFQIAGDTFDDSFAFLGHALGSRAHEQWHPPPLADPDGPLLLVSLGTTFNDRPEFFRTCVEAFDDGVWQVVMSIGDRVDPAALGPLPGNVVAAPYVPQIAVLRRARAFVTHSGMGSTLEALLLGVPQVGVPQMVEQYVNAGRVDELGLGRRLDPATLDAPTLRAAVDAVAGDPAIRAAVEAFGARMREVDGPAVGADALERFTAQRFTARC